MTNMWREVPEQVSEVTPPTAPRRGTGAFWQSIREDVNAVMSNDPAARHRWEVVLTYPGLHALWMHRIAHGCWREGHHIQAKLLSYLGRMWTGVEIHPGATIGRKVFIDHGMGVVIGETAIIGDECLIYKGVLLGGTSLERTKRHPTLGKGVVVGSNACILGNIEIGDEAKIGSGSVVVRDVPSGCTAVGVPGRIVSTTRLNNPLDHGDLPDPVATLVRSLMTQVDALQNRVDRLENHSDAILKAAQEGASAYEVARSKEEEAARMADEEKRMHEQLKAVFFEDIGE